MMKNKIFFFNLPSQNICGIMSVLLSVTNCNDQILCKACYWSKQFYNKQRKSLTKILVEWHPGPEPCLSRGRIRGNISFI